MCHCFRAVFRPSVNRKTLLKSGGTPSVPPRRAGSSRRSAWFWAPWTDLRCGQDVKDPPRCRHGGAEEATQRRSDEGQTKTLLESSGTPLTGRRRLSLRVGRGPFTVGRCASRRLRFRGSSGGKDQKAVGRAHPTLPPARIAGHWPGSHEGHAAHRFVRCLRTAKAVKTGTHIA